MLLTRRAAVRAAMETTSGVMATLTLDDGFLVNEPEFEIDENMLEREFVRPHMSPLPHMMGRKIAKMNFTTELRGNGKVQGTIGNAALITRLFRACGYAAVASSSRRALGVYSTNDLGNSITWAVGALGAATNTEVVAYYLEVVTGGASGTAKIRITSDTPGEESVVGGLTATTATVMNIGTKGLGITPTFTGNLIVGDKYAIWLLPPGLLLSPVSSGFETISIQLNKDGVQHNVPGCLGTFSVNGEAGEFPTIDWEFTGLYQNPTDATMPSPNFEKTLPSQVELARLRIDGFNAIVNAFTFDQGNDVQIRPDVSSADGYIGITIVNRNPEGGIDPEAELVATQAFWTKLAAATIMPFSMRFGTVAGNTVWAIAPSSQYTGLTYQDRNGIAAYDAGLRFSGPNGNDEMFWFFG